MYLISKNIIIFAHRKNHQRYGDSRFQSDQLYYESIHVRVARQKFPEEPVSVPAQHQAHRRINGLRGVEDFGV